MQTSENRHSVADRYARHESIEGFDQQVLANASVLVVGAGAIGNEVIKNLALLGIGKIDVVDFDRIESHNLTRSPLFREQDIGQEKARVAAGRAQELDPNITVTGFVADVWSEVSLTRLAAYDVCVACVDNFEARLRLNSMCAIARVDFVTTGIDSRYASVQRHPFGSSGGVACYECDLPAGVYSAMARRYSCGWLRKAAMVEDKVPTTVITASAAGSLAVAWVLASISGSDQHQQPARALVDTQSGRSTLSALSRNDECPGCSGIHHDVELVQSPADALADVVARELEKVERDVRDDDIHLSEPIVASAVCVNDPTHSRELDERSRWQPAANFTDAITHCTLCADTSIRVDIIETITRSQLAQAGGALNCKYLRLPGGYVVELT